MKKEEFTQTFRPNWDISALQIKGENLCIHGWRSKNGGRIFWTINFGLLGKHYKDWDSACTELYRIYCK